MAGSLLLVLVLIFFLRGLFLGFSGVIGRLLGIGLGYFLAYSYREELAAFISQHVTLSLPAIGFQAISGILIFVVTLFTTGIIVSQLLGLLGQIIPPLRVLTDKSAMSAKVAGAVVNASLGTAIGLLAIWGYSMIASNPPKEDPLFALADRFGNTVFTAIKDNTDLDLDNFTSTTVISRSISKNVTQSDGQKSVQQSRETVIIKKGFAEIVSADDPKKRMAIETVKEIIEQTIDNNNDFSSQQLQQLLAQPEASQQALDQLQASPAQLQKILNNPQLRELMEKLGQQQSREN